jgi:3-phenylpropionate/trans-cinnamate dioxygenase ferredoxin reductase component
MSEHKRTYVIVGAGMAGAKSAEALRAEGFDGRIVLIGDEDERPYERPPLSKGFLRGELDREKLYVHPESFYAEHDIELRPGTRAQAVDVDARQVVLAEGDRLRFDRLLLATGAKPRRLGLDGVDLTGVHYLRELSDAYALRAAFGRSRRLVVIGGGWIGAEVAASARQLGLEVAIVEPAEVMLERALGRELGGFYGELHRDNGVELHTGAMPVRLDGDERVSAVRLQDGRRLECDLVLVGIGVIPRTELAERAGILVENGIIATRQLETSVPGIFVAGDVASAQHPFYGRRVRVEHWANALNQPAVAAQSMLGKPAAYDRLPYFFSDQYDVGMEFVGDPAGSDELVFRGDLAQREFIAFWLSQGRVIAGMNVNVWDVVDDIKALINSRTAVDSRSLRDSDVPLGKLGRAEEAAA